MLSRHEGGIPVEKVSVSEDTTTVYNLQIADCRTYAIGDRGILVHNASPGSACVPADGDVVYGNLQTITISTGEQLHRATTGLAELTPSSQSGSPFNSGFYPSWWNRLPEDGRHFRRGHIIGDQLGGEGRNNLANLTPLHTRANSPVMRDCETFVKKLATECGYCVTLEVAPHYRGNRLYPDYVEMTAVYNCGLNTPSHEWKVVIQNTPNVSRSSKCSLQNLPCRT